MSYGDEEFQRIRNRDNHNAIVRLEAERDALAAELAEIKRQRLNVIEAAYKLEAERDYLAAERDVLKEGVKAYAAELAHWKDCHGVTADALAVEKARVQALEGCLK